MNKKLVLVVALSAMCCMAGCNSNDRRANDGNVESTTCGNITMGDGQFAYSDDFIYFAGINTFYEYDMISKNVITFSAKDVFFPDCIFVDEDYLYFAGDGLKKITRDGKKMKTVYDNTHGSYQLYVDDTKAYFMDSLEGTLYCRDLESELEEGLISGVLSYHIDNGYIYVVTCENDFSQLYKSDLEEILFEPIELEFEPIRVFATDDALYLAKKRTAELVQYKDGTETPLPIRSMYYQIVGNQLLYLDESTFGNSCFDLNAYNLDTGEITNICEDVYSFCVFLDKYIAIHRYDANFLYDMEAGTLELMYEIE